jgi:hypothetical protein
MESRVHLGVVLPLVLLVSGLCGVAAGGANDHLTIQCERFSVEISGGYLSKRRPQQDVPTLRYEKRADGVTLEQHAAHDKARTKIKGRRFEPARTPR